MPALLSSILCCYIKARYTGEACLSEYVAAFTLFVVQEDKQWMAYTGLHGPLQLLLSEQAGVLVGPRPEKPPPMSQKSEGEGFFSGSGGNIFSSTELVKFLQSIGKGSGSQT